MIDVLAASTDTAFCTTGDVMALLFGSTTTDTVTSTQAIDHLGRLVTRASGWAQSAVGVPGLVATYRETLPAYGDRWLRLSRFPVRAVLGVFDATDTGQAADVTAEVLLENPDAGLLARDQGFTWTAARAGGRTAMAMGLTGSWQPGQETRPWLVDYVAGYVPLGGLDTGSPNWTTQAAEGTSTGVSTIPEEVRHGVALRVTEFQANPLGVRSRRVGDLAVDYATAGPSGSRLASEAEAWLTPFAVKVA